MRVRKLHPCDGSMKSDRPIGDILEVIMIRDHNPIDGERKRNVVCELSDGSWEFIWNLAIVTFLS